MTPQYNYTGNNMASDLQGNEPFSNYLLTPRNRHNLLAPHQRTLVSAFTSNVVVFNGGTGRIGALLHLGAAITLLHHAPACKRRQRVSMDSMTPNTMRKKVHYPTARTPFIIAAKIFHGRSPFSVRSPDKFQQKQFTDRSL